MRYISIFSGIEAASVAWEPLGWEAVAFAEVDKFPSAVLAERFPDVPNLGDVVEVDWKEVIEKHGAVDVLVGGSPCQSFSIAGNRDGLDGASGLMWEYVRAVQEVRPRWIVWENVPGALSSGPGKGKGKQVGEDFGCLLRSLDELGYGLAWRVLDAQFFGVAQRRRRVFLVGRFGTEPPVEVLFEPNGLRWDFESGRETREILARAARIDVGEDSGGSIAAGFKWNQGADAGNYGDPCGTLARGAHPPCIVLKTDHLGQNGRNHSVEITPTLDVASAAPVVCFQQNQRDEVRLVNGDGLVARCILESPGMKNKNYVMCMADTQSNTAIDEEMSGTLNARMFKDPPLVGYEKEGE